MAFILAVLLAIGPADAERTLKVIPSKTLPAMELIVIYSSASRAPGKPKPKPIAVLKLKTETTIRLGEGPFHVYAKPKDGIEVLIADKLSMKAGETHELKLDDLLGVVDVFQKEGLPKVDRLVLTAPDDPGPDEKGHVPVQTGSDYRVEMPAPEGFYAVWLVPANGARAQRIEDRIRVLPGKIVRIGN